MAIGADKYLQQMWGYGGGVAFTPCRGDGDAVIHRKAPEGRQQCVEVAGAACSLREGKYCGTEGGADTKEVALLWTAPDTESRVNRAKPVAAWHAEAGGRVHTPQSRCLKVRWEGPRPAPLGGGRM